MNNEITDWLNTGKDYNRGIALYEKYGTEKALLSWYKMGKNSAALSSLIDELKKLENMAVIIQKQIETKPIPILSVQKKKVNQVKSIRPTDQDDAPEEVKILVKRRKEVFGEVNRLHAILSETDDLKRAIAAVKLITAWDEIESIWIKTNYFDVHKQLPVELPKVVIEIDRGESLMKRLNNLRSIRSKCKSGRLNPDRLPEVEAEIHEIELLIESSEDEIISSK